MTQGKYDMRTKIEIYIQKLVVHSDGKGVWESWDGPFKTEKIAQAKFDKSYRNKDFRVVRVTTEPRPFGVTR